MREDLRGRTEPKEVCRGVVAKGIVNNELGGWQHFTAPCRCNTGPLESLPVGRGGQVQYFEVNILGERALADVRSDAWRRKHMHFPGRHRAAGAVRAKPSGAISP